ncbi:unannotated protein [freshwater metagenome]|uniref:phosphoribosylglycinamide formyltransferase 1 n=2 Tax=freshwater metagenome TaxID=449393 RepID=A0A6J7M338_9ZZZZ|nr:phosphoribosylglycinamide formyltransferase [Actinomycetota bacterium]MSZ69099.1 phosphoribosylglycinamide formyltransferase [Actinomycetota bacterium]
MVARLVVLASGSGSLFQAIMDSVDKGELAAEIVAVISDQPHAQVLRRASNSSIPTYILPMTDDRSQWDQQIFDLVSTLKPTLVVSAGFMRILNPNFVSTFKVINSHPALLPNFPGAHAVRDALAAGAKKTGTTVHWVDSGVDTGEIIAQASVDIFPEDDEASLHERIKILERGLIVATISKLLPSLERKSV